MSFVDEKEEEKKRVSFDRDDSVLGQFAKAALALPVVGGAAVEAVEVEEIRFRQHVYVEEDVPTQSSGAELRPAHERFEIDVSQLSVSGRVGDKNTFSVSYMRDVMSGASPWYTLVDSKNQIYQVMSGASIEDERTEFGMAFSREIGLSNVGVNWARSEEDDYESQLLGVSYELGNEEKTQLWQMNLEVGRDDIAPVEAERFSTRIQSADKDSLYAYGGLQLVINRFWMTQIGLGLEKKDGFLSDPYKAVYLHEEGQLVADARPDSRFQKSLIVKNRYFHKPLSTSLHVDYRFHTDDWDVISHVFDVAAFKNISDVWTLSPSVRYYSQSSAFFYQAYYLESRDDGLRSTDYRLASFGAVTLGIKALARFEHWQAVISYKNYRTNSGWGLESDDIENPALIDFNHYSLELGYIF